MRRCIVTLVALAAIVASAVPAFGDSGTVTAVVTVDTTCLEVTPDGVDFGPVRFSSDESQEPTFRQVVARNCGGGRAQLHVRGTDAGGLLGTGTFWTLVASTSTCPELNQFALPVGGIEGTVLADTQNRNLLHLPAAEARPVAVGLQMPCEGSDGAGEMMTFGYIFTDRKSVV